MIDVTEIQAVATDLSLSPEVVEKDYVLGWLLAGIYAHPALSTGWVFKGGTCLKKCYFETYRFSEDLDFTLADPAHLNADFLRASFSEVSGWIYERTGIRIPAEQLRFDFYTNPRGGASCEGRVYYAGPRPRPGTLPRIKLDLTVDELVALPPVSRPVGHPYSDLPEEGITANCYAYEEVFGEKVRALGERCRPRDLYDVVNLFRHGEFRPAATKLIEVLGRKCAYKRIPIPTLESLQGKLQELTADWQHMLGHQLPVLPPFESFWNVLPEFFTWLNTPETVAAEPVHGVLASIQAAADEELYRPAVGALRREGIHGSSFIESIRFAGVNRLRVLLRYQGSVRMIEPYSLRRTRAGDIVIYAIKTESREVRSYRLDRIQGVQVTNEAFAPVYAIELTAGETGAIPPTTRGRLHWGHMPARTGRQGGPVYVYQCPMCQKQFRRKTRNPQLNPHKTEHGWPCSGRRGYLIDTVY